VSEKSQFIIPGTTNERLSAVEAILEDQLAELNETTSSAEIEGSSHEVILAAGMWLDYARKNPEDATTDRRAA
jgi:hypothetical protein